MRTRILGTIAAAGLVLAAAVPSQAQVAPDAAASRVTTAPTTSATAAPAVVSPRIGYVYAAGLLESGFGITVFAQQANGALTRIQAVPAGDSLHSLELVHLRGGAMALYDLNSNGLFAFHVNRITGLLTPFAVPTPSVPVIWAGGLASYDPLGHGLPGQPLLVATACGTPTTILPCPFRFETFAINPVTGALSVGQAGAPINQQIQSKLVGDGTGRISFGLLDTSTGASYLSFALAKPTSSGATGLASLGSRMLTTTPPGQSPIHQSMGRGMILTPNGLVEFAAGPIYVPQQAGGWVAYGFGSLKSAGIESRVTAEVTAAIAGRKQVYVGEVGGNLTTCALEAFGLATPGLGGVRTLVPCVAAISSLFEQGTYLYVGRANQASLGYHDVASSTVVPTAQGTVPSTGQINSWAGFLFGNPTVTVPAKVSTKVGIPVTIGCQQVCSGTTSATITIAGSTKPLHLAALTIKPHAAGTFTVKLLIPTSLRGTILLALKKHKSVKATTTTTITAGATKVKVPKTSTLTP